MGTAALTRPFFYEYDGERVSFGAAARVIYSHLGGVLKDNPDATPVDARATSHVLRGRAGMLNVKAAKMVQEEIRAIPLDDEERDYKVLKLKVDRVARSRIQRDLRVGFTVADAELRHRQRVKYIMRRAVRLGKVFKKHIKPPPPLSVEERRQKDAKKKNALHRKQRGSEKMWKTMCLVLHWYAERNEAEFIHLHPTLKSFHAAIDTQLEQWTVEGSESDQKEKLRLELRSSILSILELTLRTSRYSTESCYRAVDPDSVNAVTGAPELSRTPLPCACKMAHRGPCSPIRPEDAAWTVSWGYDAGWTVSELAEECANINTSPPELAVYDVASFLRGQMAKKKRLLEEVTTKPRFAPFRHIPERWERFLNIIEVFLPSPEVDWELLAHRRPNRRRAKQRVSAAGEDSNQQEPEPTPDAESQPQAIVQSGTPETLPQRSSARGMDEPDPPPETSPQPDVETQCPRCERTLVRPTECEECMETVCIRCVADTLVEDVCVCVDCSEDPDGGPLNQVRYEHGRWTQEMRPSPEELEQQGYRWCELCPRTYPARLCPKGRQCTRCRALGCAYCVLREVASKHMRCRECADSMRGDAPSDAPPPPPPDSPLGPQDINQEVSTPGEDSPPDSQMTGATGVASPDAEATALPASNASAPPTLSPHTPEDEEPSPAQADHRAHFFSEQISLGLIPAASPGVQDPSSSALGDPPPGAAHADPPASSGDRDPSSSALGDLPTEAAAPEQDEDSRPIKEVSDQWRWHKRDHDDDNDRSGGSAKRATWSWSSSKWGRSTDRWSGYDKRGAPDGTNTRYTVWKRTWSSAFEDDFIGPARCRCPFIIRRPDVRFCMMPASQVTGFCGRCSAGECLCPCVSCQIWSDDEEDESICIPCYEPTSMQCTSVRSPGRPPVKRHLPRDSDEPSPRCRKTRRYSLSSAAQSPLLGAAFLVSLALQLIPATSMDVALPAVGVAGGFGLFGSVIYYSTMLTAVHKISHSVPAVIEVIQDQIEESVISAGDTTRDMINTIILTVGLGTLILYLIRFGPALLKLARSETPVQDAYTRIYGPRLPGGMRQPGTPSAKDVWSPGPQSPEALSIEDASPSEDLQSVDPAKLKYGQQVRFVHIKGTNAGILRLGTFQGFNQRTGRMEIRYEDGSVRKIFPSCTRQATYIPMSSGRIFDPHANLITHEHLGRVPLLDESVPATSDAKSSATCVGATGVAAHTDAIQVFKPRIVSAYPSRTAPTDTEELALQSPTIVDVDEHIRTAQDDEPGTLTGVGSAAPGEPTSAQRTYWELMLSPFARRTAPDRSHRPASFPPTHPWERRLYTKMLSDREIRPAVESALREKMAVLRMTQYQVDDKQCCGILTTRLHDALYGDASFQAFCLLDQANFKLSSCARQHQVVKELFDLGCQFRTVKPQHGGFSCLHCKTIICDDQTLFSGSCNLTTNGLDNNSEDVIVTNDPRAVRHALATFQDRWNKARVVDQARIDEMFKCGQEKYCKKKQQEHAATVRDRLEGEFEAPAGETPIPYG